MQFVDTTFSLYGAESRWNIRLPVCSCSAFVGPGNPSEGGMDKRTS